MSTKITKHTFEGGMITDKSNNLKKPNAYDYAENLRHTSDLDNVIGSLTSLKGFESFTSSTPLSTNLTIVSHTVIRDKLYLLCTQRQSTSANDSIYRLDISYEDKDLSNLTLLYGGGNLGLNYDKNTDIVSIYENDEVIKIYWSTDGSVLRVANVATYLTTDGLVKSGSNSWIDSERFKMITTINMNSLSFDSLINGTLTTGRVQYSYSLYKDNLQETLISSPTNLIDLYNSNENDNSIQIKGDYTSTNTNKGVKLTLTLDSSDINYFNYIRLYRVHYKEYNQTPVISIVNDFPIGENTEYTLVDSGTSFLGSISAEEFTILNVPYEGKTIENKDNRLVMANIKESTFDLPDFDARAYRFFNPYQGGYTGVTDNTNSPTGYYEIEFGALVYLSVGEQIEVTFGGIPVGGIAVTVTSVITYGSTYRFLISELTGSGVTMSDGLSVLVVKNYSLIRSRLYDEYGSYSTPSFTIYSSATPGSIGYPDMTTDKELNCINPYNDIDNDLDHTYLYMYQSDGETIGGEGPEIKYNFSIDTIVLDDTSTYDNYETYSSTSDYTRIDKIFTSTGYQRDEIYRFGIVFYNSLGQKTKVKWISDIRFPTHTSYSNFRHLSLDTGTYSTGYAMGIEFTLKNGLPSGATSWEIVRAKRTKDDRTVITSGYISFTVNSFNTTTLAGYTSKNAYPLFDTTNLAVGAGSSLNYDLVNFISPEEIFQGYTDVKDGDSLYIMGDITSVDIYTSSGGTYPDMASTKNSLKYHSCKYYESLADIDKYSISDCSFIKAYQYVDIDNTLIYPITNSYDGIYRNKAQTKSTILFNGIAFTNPNYHGACNVISTSTDIDNLPFNAVHLDNELPYVLIKRNTTSRYGGSSYLERENTKYITCGYISSLSSGVFFGGDTFINLFDYIHSIYAYKVSTDSNTVSMIYPTESTINLSLRSDDHLAKVYGVATSYLTQEVAGDYTETGGDNYNQEEDLYLYNSVYSQEQNINYYIALNNIDSEVSFDTRVIYSNKKVNNELIDNWLKFGVNNFLDVDSKYGQIQTIRSFNDNIYFWQDNAFGVLPFNERALITDNNPGSLSLGTGGVLTRYKYYTRLYGCTNPLSILNTDGNLYWTDSYRKTILNYNNNELIDLPKVKGFSNITKELIDSNSTIDNFTISSTINQDYNEILFKLTDSKQLIYNTFLSGLSSVMLSNSNYTFNAGNLVVSHISDDLYGHDKTDTYNNLLNSTTLAKKASLLRITDSSEYSDTKVYDNISFFSNSKYQDLERTLDTFDTVSFWNDYQYTGVITLTNEDTIRKLERGFTLDIPRNIVKYNGLTNGIDIFNATNHDTSRTFKERMRDKYITSEFIYNTSNTGKLYIPYIQFMYRTSKR
jgi:hypothetical protein